MKYGLPKFKKFPIDNSKDIELSLQYFDNCPERFKEELATNIYNSALSEGFKIQSDHNIFQYIDVNVLTENYIISKGNIGINLNKWNKVNNKILYITGLSGSGKSTIGKEYSKKYKAEYIEFDSITSSLIHGIENLNKNKIHPIIIEYLITQDVNRIKNFDDINNFNNECVKFLSWFQNKVKEDKYSDKLFILEGMQLFLCFEASEFMDKPMIIMGTSVLKSWLRTHKRNINSKKSIEKKFLFFIKSFMMIKVMIDNDKELSKFIKEDKNLLKESEDKSKLYDDYKNKKFISLSKFKKVKITDTIAKKYNIHCTSPRLVSFKGYLYTDKNDSFVGLVAVGTYNDGRSWIQPIEVSKKYRGHGLSKQLIDVAVNELGAKYLGVFSDNEVAINIYKKYGFKIYKILSKGEVYFMTIDPKQKIGKKVNN